MLKVSFKNQNSKTVQRYNNKVTVVTLVGCMKIPCYLWECLPISIYKWLDTLNNPEVRVDLSSDGWIITSKGKAIRAVEDEDNPILAERIAEGRAKANIYAFVIAFASKLCLKYTELITGNEDALPEGNSVAPDNSLYAIVDRYNELHERELSHIKDLILQA